MALNTGNLTITDLEAYWPNFFSISFESRN